MNIVNTVVWMSVILTGTNGNDVVIGILGNSVSIDCKLPVTDTLVWQSLVDGVIAMKGELLVHNSTKYGVERYNGARESLMIHDVTLTDESEYRCFDLHNKERVFVTNLHVLVRPAYMNVTYPTTPVLEGTEVILVCETGGGKPLPDITWYSRGPDGAVMVLTGIDSHTLYTNGTGHVTSVLKLSVTRDVFRMTFMCNMSVPVFYTESMEVNLDVHLLPQTPVIMGYSGSFDENSRFELECISTGSHPTATVFWQINGSRAGDTEYVVIPGTNNTSTVRSILSRRLSRDFDGSVLTCAATNSVVSARGLEPVTASITLRMSYKPTVNIPTERYVVKTGGNITLECPIDALPVTDLNSVFWTNNEGVVSRGDVELSENASSLYLHLTNTTRSDAGQYACHVANRLGSTVDQTKLSVLHAPQCVTNQTQRIPVTLGSTVRLQCQLYAFPTAVTLFWRNRMTQEIIRSTQATKHISNEEMVYGVFDIKIRTRDQYTDIECIGTNTEIGYTQPCLYRIEPPSPAEAPDKCSVHTSDNHVSVSCQAGFHGGSKQTFLLQTQVRSSFDTIANSSYPKFGFISNINTTIRVCAVNEDFKDVIQCALPLTVHVINTGYHGNDAVLARGSNAVIYIAGGITGFVGLLLITIIVIVLVRRRHKNIKSRRTSPTVDAPSNRRKHSARLNVGDKWWYSLKPSENNNQTDRCTPALSRPARGGVHVICSTPYYGNKQPVFQNVGNSPIFPAGVQTQDLTRNDTHESSKFNSIGESTGFFVSSMPYLNDTSDLHVTVRRMENDTNHDDDNEGTKERTHLKFGVDDTKSVDICAVTLDIDYSAGDIADVLDNTKPDRINATFDLDKPNPNIVIDGTTLSFEADFSESDACPTPSNVSTSVANSLREVMSVYEDEDDVSFISNVLSQLNHPTQDETMITMVSNQLFDKKIINTTYSMQNNLTNRLQNRSQLNDSEGDMDVTLCPDVLQIGSQTSTSASCSKSKTGINRCISEHSVPVLDDSRGRFSINHVDNTLEHIDHCTLTLTDESNPGEVNAEYDTFVVTESPTCDEFSYESSDSDHCDLRNRSFRIAIDNSTIDNTVNCAAQERNRLTMYLLNEKYMSEESHDATLQDTSYEHSLGGDAFNDSITKDETVVYV